jgi:hypothetical protein
MRNLTHQTLVFALAAILLIGCASQTTSSDAAGQPYVPSPMTPSPVPDVHMIPPDDSEVVDPQLFASTDRSSLTREMEGGHVVVEVTPLPWSPQTESPLSFEVALNTHSVDLSYDISQLAVIRTSGGMGVAALTWDGPTTGDHHVSGILTFPPLSLDEVEWLELDIYDVADVSVRTFHWDAADFLASE